MSNWLVNKQRQKNMGEGAVIIPRVEIGHLKNHPPPTPHQVKTKRQTLLEKATAVAH